MGENMTEQQEVKELEKLYTMPSDAEEAADFLGLVIGIVIAAVLLVAMTMSEAGA